MMRTSYYLFYLLIAVFFVSAPAYSQNFDETWKEFLENDKISNMSDLMKPNKVTDKEDYVKYLLMNTNSNFCQSKVERAEDLLAKIYEMDVDIQESIPGFVKKKEALEAKVKAFYSIDAIWEEFLLTKEVTLESLEAVKAVKTSCEKRTLAKYSYMTAYYHFCQGDVSRSKNIFENRTLRLAEKTTLRVQDVKGLAPEVAKMKSLYQDMSKLDVAWKSYVKTGVSPGFDIDLPLFPCYPIPNMKEFLLKGAVDLCHSAPEMLERIKELQAESGVVPDRELAKKIKELEAAIEKNDNNLAVLNEAWEAFIPDNRVKHLGQYSYEYCSKEPLIRAYIMDGFSFVCDMAEESLQKINAIQNAESIALDDITKLKINELAALYVQYQSNGEDIERLWDQFVAQDDRLLRDFQSTDLYCDNIQKVKDWTMKGLSGSCEESIPYLEKIEDFNETFEFKFYEALECRVQKLRIKVWDCRYQALSEIARLGSSPDAQEEKLKQLMEEYGMEERPGVCALGE